MFMECSYHGAAGVATTVWGGATAMAAGRLLVRE